MRAKRDAKSLRTPLFLVQAADAATPPTPPDVAKKFMNKANPKDTGGMHGMFCVHLGMHMRLLEALDVDKGLVKDAEGVLVHIAFHPADQESAAVAMATGAERTYLKHLPLGFWLRMDKFDHNPCAQILGSASQGLVFVEPRTSDSFVFRAHRVIRTAFPCSHARVLTCTACQGRTMRAGVVIDCGRHETGQTKKEDPDWWLDLYVMLSRATCLQDLATLRAPPVEFLLQGPPPDLRKRLAMFARRADVGRPQAEKLARELGFGHFLH